MPEGIDRQSLIDDEHLKLLSLGYMISACVAALFAVLSVFYIAMGVVSRTPPGTAGNPPPAFVGWMFAVTGLVLFLLAVGMAVARFSAARCIKQRKSRNFCLAVAALGCLEFPYGTALGVLTFSVLGRASVAKQFTAKQ